MFLLKYKHTSSETGNSLRDYMWIAFFSIALFSYLKNLIASVYTKLINIPYLTSVKTKPSNKLDGVLYKPGNLAYKSLECIQYKPSNLTRLIVLIMHQAT